MRNFLSMNFNLKMTVERSKRFSYFLSLIFITKCFSENLLLRIFFVHFEEYAEVVYNWIGTNGLEVKGKRFA